MKAVLVLLSLGAAVMAQNFNNIVGFDVAEYNGDMPQRVYAGQPFSATITGKYIATGDAVAFTAGNDCRTVVYPATVTASSTTSGTITYKTGVAPQAASGDLRLCYKRINADLTYNGWQYYGTLFRLAVTSVDSWTDGYNEQLATGGVAQTLSAKGTNMPLRFYNNQPLPTGTDAGALELRGKNIGFSGDRAYAITPDGATTDGSSCQVVAAPSGTTGNLSGSATKATATFTSTFGATSGGGAITAGLTGAGLYWVCYSISGAVSTTLSPITRFDTKLRAVSKALDRKDYHFIFPRVIRASSAVNVAIVLPETTIRFSILGMRPGDRIAVTAGVGKTCYNTGAPKIPLAAADFSVANGYLSAKVKLTANYPVDGADASNNVADKNDVYLCHYPAGMAVGDGLDATTSTFMDSVKFTVLAQGSTNVALNTLLNNEFAEVAGGAFLRAQANTFFYGGEFTAASLVYAFSAGACATALDTPVASFAPITADWPILSYNPAAAGPAATGVKLCLGAAAASSAAVTASIQIYGKTLSTGNTEQFVLPAEFATTSQRWFMTGWVTGGLGDATASPPVLVPAINWWSGATPWGNAGAQDNGNVKTEWLLASIPNEVGNGNLCPQFAVQGLGKTTTRGNNGAQDIASDGILGVAGTNIRKAALSGSANGANVLPAKAAPVAVATDYTLCIRIVDGSRLGSWFSTTLKITQHPEVSLWPQTVSKLTTGGSIKIFAAGSLTSDLIGFEDELNFGTNGHCTKTGTVAGVGAAPGADNGVLASFATGSLTTAGGANVMCIKRAPSTLPFPFKRSGSVGIAVIDPATEADYLGNPTSKDDGGLTATGASTTAFYSSSNGLTLSWDETFTKVFDESKTFRLSKETTSCADVNIVSGSGKATVSYKASFADSGARIPKAVATVSGIGKGASLSTGAFCQGTEIITAKGAPRSFDIKGSCKTAACVAGTPKVKDTKPFKVINVGSYYPITATTYAINFDTTNGIANDRIGFRLASDTTATAPVGSSVITVGAATALGTNGILAAANVATAGLTAGGLYNAWFAAATSGSWYKTTSTITVVKLTNRYPGSVVQADTSVLYLDQAGMNGKDVYLTTNADCTGTWVAPSSTAAVFSAKKNIAPPTGTAPATFALDPLTTPSDVTWNTLCYMHDDQDTTGAGAEIPPYVPLTGFTAFIEKKETVSASIAKPIVKTTPANTNVIVLSEIAHTVRLGMDGTTGTIDGYTPFIASTATECVSATAVKLGTTTKITKDLTSWEDSTFTVNVKLSTTVAADVGKNTNAICYNIKSSGTIDNAVNVAALTAQIEVRPVPSKVGTTKPYLVTNVRNTVDDNQDLDITYAGGVTLKNTDVICLALPGVTGFNQGMAKVGEVQLGETAASTPALRVYHMAYCGQVSSDGLKATFLAATVRKLTADKDYEVWVSAGAAAGAAAASAPAKIAGSLIRTVAPDVRPRNVVSTAAGDKRILYTKSDNAADQFNFITGTVCTGFTGTANPGAAASGKLSASFDSSALYTICYQSSRETTSPKANWVALDIEFNARDTTATNLAVSSTAPGSIMLPRSMIKPEAAATDYYIRIHSGVATAVEFPFLTHAAQENDVIRVLGWSSTVPTAASCEVATPTDTPTDSAKNAGAYDLVAGTASVASSITLAALPAAAFNGERLACYRQAGVTATTTFKSFPKTTWVRIVTLDAYILGASTDLLAPGGAGASRTANANYQFQVNFWGRWVDIDDFASFVTSSSADCANAWWYENAIYGAAAAAPSTTASSSGFSTWFESGLPGGLYTLCFLARNTGTKYIPYATLQPLRILNVQIFPAFATPAVATKFTLTPTTAPGLVNFVAGDRTAITAAGGDCSTLVTTLANVTAGPKPEITLTVPANPAVKAYDICASFVGATGYNKAGAPDSVDPSGNLGAEFNSIESSTTAASVAYATAESVSKYHIRVLYTPMIAYVWPASVFRGMRTDINFFGSYLDGADQVSFTLVNGTSTPDECAAPAYENMAPNPTPFAQNWALLRGKTFANPGTWNICYKTANATAAPAKTSVHGQTVAVVAVTSIVPTSAPASSFATLVAKDPLKITLNGFFNSKASAASNPNQDFDHFALIPRNFQTRDCAGINVTVATGFGNRLTTTDGLSATGGIDTTDAPMAGDYMFCVHFAGSAWSNPIDPAKDFFLIDPREATFTLRVAQTFAPTSIVNGTAQTPSSQTVYLSGFGIRENDTVTTVPSTSTSIADCSDASKTLPVTPVNVGLGGAVPLSIPMGTYRLCWKSSAPGSAFEFVGTTNLTVEAATIKTLTTQVGGVPTAVARTVDVSDFFQVALTGTGLMNGDSARLVNVSSALAGNCDPTGTAVAGTTPWVKVAPADPLAPSVWWWEIPAGDVSVGTYALCYQWGASGPKTAFANLTVTVAANPRPLAASPRTVTRLPGTTNFLIWGAGLVAADTAALVASTGSCTALPTTPAVSVSVINAGTATTRALVNVTLPTATENTFKLCYFVGGRAPGRDLGPVVVAKDTSTCTSTLRFYCNGQCNAFATGNTSPCAAAPASICPAGSGTVACPATGYCARSADECSAVATSLAAAGGLPACPAGSIRCFDGSCAASVIACTPVPEPAPGLLRCKDGSLSTNGACLAKDGTAITKTCPNTASPNYCPAGGCPLNGGSDVKEGCAPFDGCPVGETRCPDCVCRASCGSAFGPFTCSDGKSVPDAKSCACHRFAKVPQQALSISTDGGFRRRFVVRASLAFTDVNLVNTRGQIVAKVSVDANIALDGGKCAVSFMGVADSLIDASIPLPAAGARPVNFIAAPVVMLNIINGTNACNLDASKAVTITFPVTEVTGNMTCAQLFVSGATVAPGPNPNSCRVNGTKIAAAAITLSTFPVVPKAIVPPSAAPSSTPSTLPPGATPTPGGPAASPVPSSGSTPTDTSAASMSSFSAALVVVACSLVAMLF